MTETEPRPVADVEAFLARYSGLSAETVWGMANVMRWSKDGAAPSVWESPITDAEWAELTGIKP